MNDKSDSLTAIALWLAGLAYLLAFAPLTRPVMFDPATWDYMSLALLDGRLPYRDIFLHKTPGAAFLGAAGAWAGSRLGLEPLQGAHLLFLALGAAGPALLFLLCRRSAPAIVALAAGALLLAFEQWPLAALEGVRPKVATTVFGLGCLLASGRGRDVLAGALGGFAVLCWQPGVVFLLGAAAERRQPKALVRTMAGAGAVAAAFLVWLGVSGSTTAFFSDAVVFNVAYVQEKLRSPAATLRRLWHLLRQWNADLLALLPAAAAGALLCRIGGKKRATGIPLSLGVAGLAYLALTFLSLQAWPDTILLGPPLAAGLASGIAALASRLEEVAWRLAMLAVIAAAVALALDTHSERFHPPLTYDEQAAAFDELLAGVPARAPIVAIGVPELLIHSGRHSIWPWPYMWFGVDRFAADHTPGGFPAMLASLDAQRPERIFLARRWHSEYRSQFERWAASRYRRRRAAVFPHVARPIIVYERISR
ncbi:MAG: hypothetical protein D6760_01920 [Deltaproteobacteria bacterium]|nr:MAG: hypothetical protein D6760_01920 [Deltaproteobacteria bacterium]